MRYTKEQLKKLRERWGKPLIDPETGEPTDVEGCKTFQELLSKRLVEISLPK